MNASYCGAFVTKLKEEFSNSQNANIQKWSAFIKGIANRQDFLHCALVWVSKGKIDSYMSKHRTSNDISDVTKYFNGVIDWASTVFTKVYKEMKGLEWGRLYETYHNNHYDFTDLNHKLNELMNDDYVSNQKGIFEYVLG